MQLHQKRWQLECSPAATSFGVIINSFLQSFLDYVYTNLKLRRYVFTWHGLFCTYTKDYLRGYVWLTSLASAGFFGLADSPYSLKSPNIRMNKTCKTMAKIVNLLRLQFIVNPIFAQTQVVILKRLLWTFCFCLNTTWKHYSSKTYLPPLWIPQVTFLQAYVPLN